MAGDEQVRPSIPVFHPIHMRDLDAWFPGNDAASLMIHLGHAYEDMIRTLKLREGVKDEYTRRLLLKYAAVELRAMLPLIEHLQGEVMRAAVVEEADSYPWRAVTKSQMEECQRLFKTFNRAKASAEKKLVGIRNRIGAHRSVDPWDEVMRAWDELTPELISPLASTISPLYNYVARLDIFDWTRCPDGDDGVIEIFGGRISW